MQSVLKFFTDYAPLEELSLAENISLVLSFANRDENVISKLSRQFISRIFSKTMLSLNDGTKREVIEFLQGIGIKFGEEEYIFCSADADIPASKPPFGYKRALNKKEIEFLKLKKVGEINPM